MANRRYKLILVCRKEEMAAIRYLCETEGIDLERFIIESAIQRCNKWLRGTS